MKKLAALALACAGFMATPAYANAPPAPPPVTFPCDPGLITPDAMACAGYYSGNLLNGSAVDINAQIAALASIGFPWSGDWTAVNKIEANTTPLTGAGNNQLDFGQLLYGINYIGAHFGNVAGAPQGQGNVSVFWKVDFGTDGGYLTLDNTKGWSNAVLYTGTPPVPEPATWMMLLLGFAAVGATLRSRRTSLLGTLDLVKG